MLQTVHCYYLNFITHIKQLDGIAPLLLRLILAPVLIIAGYSKLGLSGDWQSLIQALLADPNVVNWFGNAEWGLGLPFPDLLAFLAAWSEISRRLVFTDRLVDSFGHNSSDDYHGGGSDYCALEPWLVCYHST